MSAFYNIYQPIPNLSLKHLCLLTSTDDIEYQSAFAALDELRLGNLKPFFKEQCLQVTEMLIYDYRKNTFSSFLPFA